jgi:tRNA threonylcarbamoyladenosine biosynthesis protein TsaE
VTQALNTRGPDETLSLGERMGRLLKPLDILCLRGELGSGKTTFVSGLVRGLGIPAPVQSPTFTLERIYRRKGLVFHHFDLYRVAAAHTGDVGIEAALQDPAGVIAIEWPESGDIYLPGDRLDLRFFHSQGDARRIRIEARGQRPKEILAALMRCGRSRRKAS